MAGQPVSGGLACYFKEKPIYFSSPSSFQTFVAPHSNPYFPVPFITALILQGGELSSSQGTWTDLFSLGKDAKCQPPAQPLMLLIQSLEPGTSIIHCTLS